MDLIQFKKRQKVHGVNLEKDNITYCCKPTVSNAFFAGSGDDQGITCGVCSALVEDFRRIEKIERANYDGMTYKEYKAHLKAQSMGKSVYGTPMIIIEDEKGKQVNSFVMTPGSVRKLYTERGVKMNAYYVKLKKEDGESIPLHTWAKSKNEIISRLNNDPYFSGITPVGQLFGIRLRQIVSFHIFPMDINHMADRVEKNIKEENFDNNEFLLFEALLNYRQEFMLE